MENRNYLNELKQTGYKLTSPRREILNVLSAKLLSSQQVWEMLRRRGFFIDLVTVYRTLELFKSLGLVSKIQFEDKSSRYELINNNHHHHLVCIKCAVVENVNISEENITSQIKKQSSFQVQRHALEFFGFCKRCKN